MRFQTIVGIGVVGIIAFLLYKFFTNSAVQGAATAAGSFIENAATGQISGTQAQEIISQNAASLVQASGGTMTQAQATAQATQDFNASQVSGAPTYWDGVKAAFSGAF